MGRERHTETLKGNLPMCWHLESSLKKKEIDMWSQSTGGLPVKGDSRSRGPGLRRRVVSMTEMQGTLNPLHGGTTSVKEGDFSRDIH